jgi:mannosyltransferase
VVGFITLRRGPTKGTADPRRSGRVVAANIYWTAPALLMLGLGLWRVARPSLWRDEVITWTASTRPVADLVRTLRAVDGALGPYYLMMHAWTAVFGSSELALRLPSVLAMAATAGFVARITRELADSSAGLLAGTAFAVIPNTSRYAQEARPYAIAAVLAAAATLLLLRALAAPSRLRWFWYAVVLALTGLGQLFAATIVLAHGLAVLGLAVLGSASSGRRRLTGWATAAVGAMAVIAPVAVVCLHQRGQVYWLALTDWDSFASFPAALAGAPIVGGLVLALGVVGLGCGRRVALVAGCFAVVPFVALFLAGVVVHLFHARYLLPTLSGWAVLAGVGLTRCGPRSRWALLAVILVFGLPAQLRNRGPDGHSDAGPRAASTAIAAQQLPGDGIVYGDLGWVRLTMDFYLPARERPRDVLLVRGPAERHSYVAEECHQPAECLSSTTRLWAVCASRSLDCLSGAKRAAIRASYTPIRTARYGSLTVALYQRY